MFTALKTLLAQVVSLTTSMVLNDDGTITVTVIPKVKKDKEGENFAALNTPLVLTGTADELDAEFATILTSYTSKRSSLAEQLEATEAVLEAAKKASVKKATTRPATKAASATTSDNSGEGGDDDHSLDDNAGSTATAGEQSSSGGSDNLWDDQK